jgi:MinD-like ATPase involved in chromosome partitioning or flagellar assembly
MGACLSETGGGKVLMVDMTPEHGTMKRFYKGEYDCTPDAALEADTRDITFVQDNLYVVNGTSNGDGRPKILPKQFIDLVARLRTADYDYVIFDMPPISQISATSHLAGYMDLVLLVVESEKTGRDAALQASALLAKSKANVCVVLNKTRSYGPLLMRQEFLSET